MALVKLQFKPGLSSDGSRYSGVGEWIDGDKVRFRLGAPEKIGGWQRTAAQGPIIGVPRALLAWASLDGTTFLGVGTSAKYYIESIGSYNDATPLRRTVTVPNAISSTSGSQVFTIADTGHGALAGDYVTITGAAAVGGQTLAGEYLVQTVPNADTFTVRHTAAATSTVASGGGAGTVLAYQINTGITSTVYGLGYGAGGYGGTGYGMAAAMSAAGSKMRLWSHDVFGQDLVINPRDGGIYYWQASGGLGTRAKALSSLPGAASVPALARQILVSDQDRRLFAFGCTDLVTGAQDALLLRWTDAENPVDWAPTDINTAGDLRIPTGAEFIAARETKAEILVWADDSLHSLRYVGAPYYYGINRIGLTTVISPNAIVIANDLVMWMGLGTFSRYDGRIVPLPCPVHDHVFEDMNLEQVDKITAGSNMGFNEAWWFYPSAGSAENDRYVCYNYVEDVWTYGTMNRTAWLDRAVEDYPRAASPDGAIFFHELGVDDGSTNPVSGIEAWIESGPVEIGNGDAMGFVSRMIPDVGFRNSTGSPLVTMTLSAQNAPGDGFAQTEDRPVRRTSTVPIDQHTKYNWLRLRGRALTLKVSSNTVGTAWRLGTPRVDVRADGRRA